MQYKRTAMYTLIHTNKYIEHQANNNNHEEKTCMRMHKYKRLQKTLLEGENKNLPPRERSLD